MSNVNIKRAIENIRSGTSIYTPVVEVVVNAIQAIEAKSTSDGLVEIVVQRHQQMDLNDPLPEIDGFEVSDNGVGFNDSNRASFDTLYSAHKISEGGKGFGRFTCLKYFEDMEVESTFSKDCRFFDRSFSMGKENEIIINEKIALSNANRTGTRISLMHLKRSKFPDKKLATIARAIVEKLLPFFVNQDMPPPRIVLREKNEEEVIVLNDYVETYKQIIELDSSVDSFLVNSNTASEEFSARVFKFYSPRSQTSKISLVAHRREVTSVSLQKYIPEFADEFFEQVKDGEEMVDKNFTLKVYVFGRFLDDLVSLERGGFEFQKESDAVYGISQSDIEKRAADIAREAVSSEVQARFEKKVKKVNDYVKEKAPWHAGIVNDIDLSDMPYNATDEQIESKLQKEKYEQEVRVRYDVRKLLEKGGPDELKEKASEIVSRISGAGKNDLAHYIALRRSVIDLFEKSLELNSDGTYSSEGVVHDIIFPRKGV